MHVRICVLNTQNPDSGFDYHVCVCSYLRSPHAGWFSSVRGTVSVFRGDTKILSVVFGPTGEVAEAMSALKRARWQDPWDDNNLDDVEEEGADDIREQSGKSLEDYLLQLKIMGKLQATHVTTIAYFHRMSGGCGCDRISLPPQKDPSTTNPSTHNAHRTL